MLLRVLMNPRYLAVAACLFAGYPLAYFCDRTVRRTSEGAIQIECRSRLSAVLFAPAIALESRRLSRANVDAEQRLATALADAKATNRKVLLTLGTEFCLSCRQLEQFLEERQDLLAAHFIVVRIDCYGEMLHGKQVQDRYRPDDKSKPAYYPWVAILDEEGHTIVTGDDGPPKVIGLAHGGPDDRAWFLAMLKKAVPQMTDEELTKLHRAALAFHEHIWQKSSNGD